MNVQRIAKRLENNDIKIRQIVLDTAQKKNQIIYGQRAINPQVPTHLKKKTSDYDIYTSKPKKSARELVNALKRQTGKDFKIVKGKHKGTFKIKDSSGKTIVDYTQLKSKPKTKLILGNKYYDIKSIKRNTQRLVKKPSAEFRREKDLTTLQRIQELERIEKSF